MAYKMTDKGKDLIKTKTVDGVLWLAVDLPEERKCSSCGYSGIALDEHHIHGRKNSDETITLCSNCHREYHAGTRQL
jgi:CRISPR/Cas system-associated protein Cas10 (large subunit of type III CRISPR-Cas system)